MTASFDSNVPIYLVSGDAIKIAKSRSLLLTPGIASVQVLNEVTATLRSAKRGRTPVSWSVVDNLLGFLRTHHQLVPVDEAVQSRARMYAERYQLRILDANIVAAAVLAGCDTLWSEDMHDGLVIEGLTVRNPYV